MRRRPIGSRNRLWVSGAVSIAVALAVALAGLPAAASAQPAAPSAQTVPPGPTAEQYQQIFGQAAGSAANTLARDVNDLQRRAGIKVGDGKVSQKEVERAGGPRLETAMLYVTRLLVQTGHADGAGWAVNALFAWLAAGDPTPYIPMVLFIIWIAAVVQWFGHAFDGSQFGVEALAADLQPVISEAARNAHGQRPVLPGNAETTFRNALQQRGIAGGALEAFTQLEMLTSGVLLADARN